MSIASKIRDYLVALPPGEGYTPFDLDKMAEDMKIPRRRLSSHVSAMVVKGKIEAVRDENRHLIGFTKVHTEDRRATNSGPRRKPKASKTNVVIRVEQPERPVRRLVQTPELDRVHEARSAMAEFVKSFPGIVDEARATGSIRIDPEKAQVYAQEGLSLLERNQWLESRNRELRERNAQLERELGYKKAKDNQELRTALVTAGVVHGD